MKNIFIYKHLLVLTVAFFFTYNANAQYVQLDAITNGTVVNTCASVLQTSGGSGGASYSTGENYVVTICPDVPGDAININMITFALDPTNTVGGGPCGGNADEMCFWDGDDMSAPSLGCYTCTSLSGTLIQCTTFNPSGCLTVRFKSNSTGTGTFSGSISCVTPCIRPTAALAAPTAGIIQKICVGETLTFNGTPSYAAPTFSIVKYIWNFGDGTIDSTSGPIVSYTFVDIGEHLVDLFIRDNNNCVASNLVTVPVWVSTTPTFTNITQGIVFCENGGGYGFGGGTGSGSLLVGAASPTTYIGNSLQIAGDTLYIPDDVGSCFESEINVNIFSPGQTLNDIDDLISITADMEHSYMGDIVISITCPDGSSAILHNQGGGGTQIGEPIDVSFPASADPVGVTYPYGWSPSSTLGTFVDFGTGGGFGATLPAGIYESVNPLDSLEGCPLNGTWSLQICDFLGSDDGWVTSWGLNFAPALYPDITEYTPVLIDGAWSGADPASTSIITSTNDSLLTISNYVAGGGYSFIYTVSDDFGCTYDTTILVTVLSNPIADAGPDLLACPGIDVQLNGTATSGPYIITTPCVYTINMQDNAGFGWNGYDLNVTVGSTTTPITLISGFSGTASFSVPQGGAFSINSTWGPSLGSISYTIVNPDGVIIASEGPGVVSFSTILTSTANCDNTNYLWASTIGVFSDSSTEDPTIVVTTTTNAIFTVIDGFCYDTDTMTILASATGNLEVLQPDTSVCGTLPASPQAVQAYLASNVQAGSTFAWSGDNPAQISNPTISNPILSPSTTTTYTLNFIVPAGCSYIDTFTINFNDPPTTYISANDTICKGEQAPLLIAGGDYWEWQLASQLTCKDCTNPVATPEYTTTYFVWTYNESWCRKKDSVTIVVYPNVILDVTPQYSEVYAGDVINFEADGYYSAINWSSALYLTDSTSSNPVCTPEGSIVYIIAAEDAFGICRETDTVYVDHLGCSGFKMASAFTPNGDNNNDVLYVLQSGFEEFEEFTIYNRWGEQVFATNNIGNGWNGSYKGAPQETGTYVYNIKGSCEGKKIDIKGSVSLMR